MAEVTDRWSFPATWVPPDEWGGVADYRDISVNDSWVEKEWLVCHYGGGANDGGVIYPTIEEQIEKEMAVLRSWERYHMSPSGTSQMRALAYNLAVGQSGTVYVARLWGHNGGHYSNDDIDQDGTPENVEGCAMVWIGGGSQRPTAEALDAMCEVREWIQGEQLLLPKITDHRSVAASGGHSTACPGPFLPLLFQERWEERQAVEPWNKPVPWWAEEAWAEARRQGKINKDSDPDAVVDTKRLMVYAGRFDLL